MSEMPQKTCSKCKVAFEASFENFYRHPSGRHGFTPRCKSCVNEDNAEGHARRLAENPEKVRADAAQRVSRWYHRNIEEQRKKHRAYAAKRLADPVKGPIIRAKKRGGHAGLTQSEIDQLFEAQGSACAICRSREPNAKTGWNLDHCHRTRRVRFVLCAHCNRGLGAFKDDVSLMRRAAQVLETYQNQPDRPVEAILEAS